CPGPSAELHWPELRARMRDGDGRKTHTPRARILSVAKRFGLRHPAALERRGEVRVRRGDAHVRLAARHDLQPAPGPHPRVVAWLAEPPGEGRDRHVERGNALVGDPGEVFRRHADDRAHRAVETDLLAQYVLSSAERRLPVRVAE